MNITELKSIFPQLPTNASAAPDSTQTGMIVSFSQEKPAATLSFTLGGCPSLSRLMALYRYDPFWTTPRLCASVSEVPVETQFLLAQTDAGLYVIIAPLVVGSFRCWIRGTADNALQFVAESGDACVLSDHVGGLFVASGEDPFDLMERSAKAVVKIMNSGRLRKDKPAPNFLDEFGWCTWDAFYQEVSAEKVIHGLKTFADGDAPVRMVILDDGWLSNITGPNGGARLTHFQANERFPQGLAPLVDACRKDMGISTFMVWHAMGGYWAGCDTETLREYDIRSLPRVYPPGILEQVPTINDSWGGQSGVIPPESVHRFYHDFHRFLREQGVDGVKVDNQGSLLGLCQGSGGAVHMARVYHEALEGAAQTHFLGNVINCMASFNETYYSQLNSNLTRTFTDFWPNVPASHGLHIFANAHVTMWYGQFTYPDWDMFQSGHAMGPYHAAARAVGGCPVYVSDKPEGHDFDVLRKLVLPDGTILRCTDVGRPTLDSIFVDPTKEDALYKVFNHNAVGGIVGAFHCRYGTPETPANTVTGGVCPADVQGLQGTRFAVYAHHGRTLRIMERDEVWPVTLEQLTCELFTISPIVEGVAAIGATGMFNSGGAITTWRLLPCGAQEFGVRAVGDILLYCKSQPKAVKLDGTAIEFSYTVATGELRVSFPSLTRGILRVSSTKSMR